MTNSPQTETTLTHEQNTCLFEDTIDPRLDETEELNSAQIGELLNRLGHRRQHNEKLLGDILQEVGSDGNTGISPRVPSTPPDMRFSASGG